MSDVNQVAPADYAAEMAQLSGETAPVVEQAVETTPVVDNAVESDTFDPSTLSPSAKAHWDKQQQAIESERRRAKDFETRYVTLHGRVSPLQREVERLKRQQTQAPRPAPAAPAPVSKDSLQNWDKYRSELPDEAAAIEQFLKAQLRDELGRFQPIPEDVAALRKELAELREKEAVRATTEARAALLLALDGIHDVVPAPPPVWPDAGTNPPGWRSIDV